MAMTEQEWLAYEDPTPMLELLREQSSDRKSRLFGCACLRHLWSFFDPEYEGDQAGELHRWIEVAEGYADGQIDFMQRRVTYEAAVRKVRSWHERCFGWEQLHSLWSAVRGVLSSQVKFTISGAAHQVVEVAAFSAWMKGYPDDQEQREQAERQKVQLLQAQLLRDVVGNPFRPVNVEPAWLPSNVTSLAHTIYDDRAFERMPILADALEDAGCDNADILNHCRQPGEHVRGCWVVDLVLGKS
jgi:hypothetical protein